MDRVGFSEWLERYFGAWRSGDPADVAALYTEDAAYLHGPFENPIQGREAIVADWTSEPDPPGSWRADVRPVAFENDVGIAEGVVTYVEAVSDSVRARWSNVFICRFDADGRCREHRQWCIRMR